MKILISIDGSEHADYSFNWYFDHVHLDGNELMLIHCAEPLTIEGDEDGFSPENYQTTLDDAKGKAQELAERYEKLLKERQVVGSVEVIVSYRPGETIVEQAGKVQPGMIVIGCRGMGKLRRTILGSVSDYVVHHAKCPVVVCR